MAAVPFSGRLRLRAISSGEHVTLRFGASDVADARVTFTDLDDRTAFVVPQGGYVVEDMTLSGSGTDTSTLQVRKGVQDKSIYLDNALLANTSTDRATRLQGFLGARLEPGSEYGFSQRA